jgi:DNA-binding MarR family transcriptional regulator
VTISVQLGNDLLRGAARLNRWASRHASLGVPFAQVRLLALIDELGPARISTLAHADHCSQPATTTAVQRLEALGWVQRIADPQDARASLVSLSPAGREALDGARAARADVLQPALERLEQRDPTASGRVQAAIAVIAELLEVTAHETSGASRVRTH